MVLVGIKCKKYSFGFCIAFYIPKGVEKLSFLGLCSIVLGFGGL
jgi:hypothetical protein